MSPQSPLRIMARQPFATDIPIVNPVRKLWARNRQVLETRWHPQNLKNAPSLKDRLFRIFEIGLKGIGLFERGKRNALDLYLHDIEVVLPDLPKVLNGYRILHITDPHIDACEGLDRKLASVVSDAEADLCVLTGDYREAMYGACDEAMKMMAQVVEGIHCPDGVYAVLGNHDSQEMVPHLEDMNVRVLINESDVVKARGEQIILTGTDDVHDYFTANAPLALQSAPDGFKVALIHSPELAGVAAENGFSLYLCGHTHGGQICLPGGRPILTHLNSHKDLSNGLWNVGKMLGYTSPGAGTSVMPVRFFKRPEITRFTLRSQEQ